MAITSEIIGKLGGGDVETIPVGQFSGTDLVIYSFTLDKPSVVSAALTGFHETEGNVNRWGPPAPSIEIRPSAGGGVWGETQFGTSLMARTGSGVTTPESQTGNARYLSISAPLPPGIYEIAVNANGSSRTYTVDTATIVTTPL